MLLVRRKEVGLEGNVGRTKCMFMSYEQNAGHKHDINIFFKILAKFGYLE